MDALEKSACDVDNHTCNFYNKTACGSGGKRQRRVEVSAEPVRNYRQQYRPRRADRGTNMPLKSRSKAASKQSKTTAGKTTTATATTTAKKTTESASKEIQAKTPSQNEPNTSLLKRVLKPGTEISATEAFTVVHWIRQLLGIFVGISFGLFQLTGFPAIMSYVALSLTMPFSILSLSHELDVEEVSEAGSIQTEGFLPATALFFLCWIISFTIFLPATR